MNFLGYLSFLLAVILTAVMNFLGYLSFLLAVIVMISFVVCMVVQQIVTYHSIIEKARKFAKYKPQIIEN
jgi:pilus assembly protein TadC